MSQKDPSGLNNVQGASDPEPLLQDNVDNLNLSEAYYRRPSQVNGSDTTTVGPPTSGDHLDGEKWVDANESLWICITAGTPGTWVQADPAIVSADPADPGVDGYRIWRSDLNYRERYWDVASSSWKDQAKTVAGGAAGSNQQVQYNSSGVLAGDANFLWDSAAQLLSWVNGLISGFLDWVEITKPANPSANRARLYAVDQNGETRLRYLDSEGRVTDLAQDNTFVVRNTTGGSLSKGDVVYVTAQTGRVPDVDLAKSDAVSTMPAVAMIDEDIADNSYGIAISLGLVESIDTSAFTANDTLYLSATTAGAFTATRPPHPHLNQEIGRVLVSGAGNGSVKVSIKQSLGDELGTRQDTYRIGDGTAGNKTLLFDADTDAQVYYNGTDIFLNNPTAGIRLQEAGSDVLVTDGSGRVGIGTLNPVDSLNPAFGGSNQLPKQTIYDGTAGRIPSLVIAGEAGGAVQFTDENYSATADFGVLESDLYFVNRNAGSIFFRYNPTDNAMQVKGNGDVIMGLNGKVGIGRTSPSALLDLALSSDTQGLSIEASNAPQTADLVQVTSNGGAAGDLFTIDGSGKVGVGETSPNSLLDVNGSVSKAQTTVSSNTTLDDTHYSVFVDASAGAVTITLPAASAAEGRIYNIKKIDSSGNNVVVDGNSTETIDGSTTNTISTQYNSITIQATSTEWFII